MTLNDLLEQDIKIEGASTLSTWKDGDKSTKIYVKNFEFREFDKNLLDLEILYIYCKDNKLCVELKENRF